MSIWGGTDDRLTDCREWLVQKARVDSGPTADGSIDFRQETWPEEKVETFDHFRSMARIVWGRVDQWIAHEALLVRNIDKSPNQMDFIRDFEGMMEKGW